MFNQKEFFLGLSSRALMALDIKPWISSVHNSNKKQNIRTSVHFKGCQANFDFASFLIMEKRWTNSSAPVHRGTSYWCWFEATGVTGQELVCHLVPSKLFWPSPLITLLIKNQHEGMRLCSLSVFFVIPVAQVALREQVWVLAQRDSDLLLLFVASWVGDLDVPAFCGGFIHNLLQPGIELAV